MKAARFLLLTSVMLAPAAQARPDRPMVFPRQDVTVAYRVRAKDAPTRVTAMVRGGGHALRLEAEGQPGAIVVDRDAGTARIVLPNSNFSLESSLGHEIDQVLDDPQARFERLGEASVAGRPCATWRMTSPRASGTGCVTDDGVILRVEGRDKRGQSLAAEAESVTVAPLPASAFAVAGPSLRLDSLKDLGRSLRSP